jgi:hypothetical protein
MPVHEAVRRMAGERAFMEDWALTDSDRLQAGSLGISEAQLRAQVEILRKSDYFMRLQRPATLGDGVLSLAATAMDGYAGLQQQAARQGRFLKFVPASGAATRMFQMLAHYCQRKPAPVEQVIRQQAARGDASAAGLLLFMDNLERFAFFDDLRTAMAGSGIDLQQARAQGQWLPILEHLLTARGLNYAALPKGLLKFHRHGNGNRTAFEEHLVEATQYVRDREGVCRLHFTVSAAHEEGFRQLLARIKSSYELCYQARFQVEFSVQKRSTDTVAVDLENRPFRDRDGRLLFRPGGHGALLANLSDLQGDLIYLKNIDNVVPDRGKETSIVWKKVLGGYLVAMEEAIHGYLRNLLQRPEDAAVIGEIVGFLKDKLFVQLPDGFGEWPGARLRNRLVSLLNRPIRVCGMVRNVGEPGGGPFWVVGKDGALSLQIVESAQVDPNSPEQQAIWNAATHFNPVDLVCSVRDYAGNPFDLTRHVDPDAVFIARKSKDGRDIKALELPGLWNGAMADWITFFVEVPGSTFNPVKTVNVLLTPEHQPG